MNLTGDILQWLGWLLGLGFAISMIWLALWALVFNDKQKRRRRCPKCWHDLTGTPGLTCGECGYTATHEADLHRVRRRWRAGVLAIVALAVGAIFLMQRMADRGLVALAPTKVIILSLPLAETEGDLMTELRRRIAESPSGGSLSSWEWSMLVERCVDGDAWAQPAGDEWTAKYGSILRTFRRHINSTPELKEKVLDAKPRVVFTGRKTWPRGEEVCVMVDLLDWWPPGYESRMTIDPHLSGVEPKRVYRSGEVSPWSMFPIFFPPLDESKRIEMDVTVERRRAATNQPWEVVDKQRRSLALHVQDEPIELEPISGPSMNSLVRQVFSGGVVKWNSGESPVRNYVNINITRTGAYEDVAFGVAVELLRDETIARRLYICWRGGVTTNPRASVWTVDRKKPQLLSQINTTDGRWRLRVRGVRDIALRSGKATKYWSGEVEVPLRVRTLPGKSSPRPWWTEGGGAAQEPSKHSK